MTDDERLELTDAELEQVIAPLARVDLADEAYVSSGRSWSSLLQLSGEQRRQRLVRVRRSDWRLCVDKAPQGIGFLPALYRRVEHEQFGLTVHELLELNAAWQRYRRGVRYPHCPWLCRPFLGVFVQPNHFQHYRLLDDWLARNTAAVGRALDLGVGSGAIAMQLLHALPQAHVVASDVHSNAVVGMRLQADGLPPAARQRLQLVRSDLFDQLAEQPPFDLVVCNPPWLPGLPRSPSDAGNFYPPGFFARLLRSAQHHLAPRTGRLLLMFSNHDRLRCADPDRYVHPIVDAVAACPAATVEQLMQRDWDPVRQSPLRVELWIISYS